MPGTDGLKERVFPRAAQGRLYCGKDRLMSLHLRSMLKALPIWDPSAFPLRSAIAHFMAISEQSTTVTRVLEAAMGGLSDDQLDRYTYPEMIRCTSEATTFLANKEAQSCEYRWRQQGDCLLLLARSSFAKDHDVPGVAFEFVIRTGKSAWRVYRVPEPCEVFDCAIYLERNELAARSHRPCKLPIGTTRQRWPGRLGRAAGQLLAALSPLPRHKESEGVAVSGALPS